MADLCADLRGVRASTSNVVRQQGAVSRMIMITMITLMLFLVIVLIAGNVLTGGLVL